MARIELAPVTQWITAAAAAHGAALPTAMMQRLGISRRHAGTVLRRLAKLQWLADDGTPRRPRYSPGPLRQVVQRYALAGLDEELPWQRDFAPFFDLPREVRRMGHHAFTELLNNAIDHSGGSAVTVSMRQTPLQLQLLVSDNGCGLFSRIEKSFAIADPALAMLELSKGKLTSAPERHRGHGLFFTSRLADVFDIHADDSAFQCRSWEDRWHRGRAAVRSGTAVYVAITLDSPRTVDTVLNAHSAGGRGCGFDRTLVPLRLIAGADRVLASRADAKRVAVRLDQFSRAEIDFDGIDHVGHGFADELFRVFQRRHPALALVPVGMSAGVAAMVDSVRGDAHA